MTIDKKQLEGRLAELEAGHQSLLDQLNSCMGNIQDCRYWLDRIAEAEKKQAESQ